MSELLNADAPGGSPPASPPRGRPRLQLKKRDPAAAARLAQQAPRRGSNPFGDAKPREEVLTGKGIDVKAMDRKTELKAQAAHRLTRQQREEADAIAAEVKHAEEALREANEKELPENALRATLEQKRKELNDLMEQFAAANLEARSQPRPRQGGQPRAKPASFAQAAGGAAPPPQTGPKPSILGGGGPKPSIL